MLLDRALDLLGEHLLPAGVHAHVAAAEQGDCPVLFDPGEVTWHHVPLPVDLNEHGSCLHRVLVVAERHVPAPRDPADLARTDLAAGVVNDDRARPGGNSRPAAGLRARADEADPGEPGL